MTREFSEGVVSSSSAPVSSRNPQWMSRTFRRVDGARITSYFSVRKRARDDEAKDCCKRARLGLTVCDVKFISQAEACNGMSPLFLRCVEFQNECCAIRNSSVTGRVVRRIPTPLGTFGELPSNLFHLLFDNLEVSCLIALCLTSTAFSKYALDYVHSHSFLRRAQRESTRFIENETRSCKYFTPSDPFYCYGKLLKSICVYLPISKKVEILISFCERAFLSDGIDNLGVGRVLHTMCSNWAFSERAKVLEAVLEWRGGQLKNALKELSDRSPGSIPKLEMQVRESICQLLLSGRYAHYDGADSEYTFWLSAVIRTMPLPSNQSKLLMVLFGPTTTVLNEIIDWRLLCENSIASQQLARALLKPLSDVLYSLLKTKDLNDQNYFWSQHDVFNLIEELSTIPEPWSFDNFVSLLLHRPQLIPISLVARMNHNYVDEACLMFNSFMTISYRWNMNIDEVVRQPLMQTMHALTRDRGREFYDNVCDLYARQMKEFSLRGEEGADDLAVLMAAHAALAPLLQDMSVWLW
ncbi:hypothetical protein Angca_006476 [Angiostrongylus cantonensis]|nr:hypothetical protein Angca_006476 [Angiostrongylus cantonensis]